MYALVAYWLIFWQRFLRNPYLLCTSEIATTYFPFWISMGRKWKAVDDIYYKYPACIPFLSMWYWPSVLVSKLTRYMSLNIAFKLYTYFILAHYLIASLVAYKLLGLFGALTLTYAGYCIKPQTPAFVYTMCWMPGMLIGGWFGVFSCFMAITGGYWPILVYFMPVAAIVNPWCLLGIIPALVQIVPFAWYWKRSVRSDQKADRETGSLPWWKLKDLFWPTNSVSLTKGVHYPEAEMYMGLACLFIWQASWWWCITIVCFLFVLGLIPPIQRISARALYLLTLSICLSIGNVPYMPYVVILQGFLLLRNSVIYPSFPFSQWWRKPSLFYPKGDYTGYLTNRKVNDYRGAFALKESWTSAS